MNSFCLSSLSISMFWNTLSYRFRSTLKPPIKELVEVLIEVRTNGLANANNTGMNRFKYFIKAIGTIVNPEKVATITVG